MQEIWGISEFSQETMQNVLNDNYYFDNFIQYLSFHKIIEMDHRQKVSGFVSEKEFRKLVGMVQFELFYQRIFGRKKISGYEEQEPKGIQETQAELRNKFGEMIDYLKGARGALDGEIIVPCAVDRENMNGVIRYIAQGLRKGTDLRSLENNEKALADFMWNEITSVA